MTLARSRVLPRVLVAVSVAVAAWGCTDGGQQGRTVEEREAPRVAPVRAAIVAPPRMIMPRPPGAERPAVRVVDGAGARPDGAMRFLSGPYDALDSHCAAWGAEGAGQWAPHACEHEAAIGVPAAISGAPFAEARIFERRGPDGVERLLAIRTARGWYVDEARPQVAAGDAGRVTTEWHEFAIRDVVPFGPNELLVRRDEVTARSSGDEIIKQRRLLMTVCAVVVEQPTCMDLLVGEVESHAGGDAGYRRTGWAVDVEFDERQRAVVVPVFGRAPRLAALREVTFLAREAWAVGCGEAMTATRERLARLVDPAFAGAHIGVYGPVQRPEPPPRDGMVSSRGLSGDGSWVHFDLQRWGPRENYYIDVVDGRPAEREWMASAPEDWWGCTSDEDGERRTCRMHLGGRSSVVRVMCWDDCSRADAYMQAYVAATAACLRDAAWSDD
jgi:hypothetical protein